MCITPMVFDPFISEKKVPLNMFGIRQNMYRISNLGYIEPINDPNHFKNDKKTALSSQKYPTVSLVMEDKNADKKTFRMDYLVASAFNENQFPEDFNSVIHKNGIESDCCAGNLEWGSRGYKIAYSKNIPAEYELTDRVKKETNGWYTAKLTEDQVVSIKKLHKYGLTAREVIDVLNLDISESAVRNIFSNQNWKHVQV